jgi:GAF domain-containing protein
MTKVKILLVDDDSQFLDETKKYLSQNGFEVDSCQDGQGAEAMLRKHGDAYDVILVDWMLNTLEESGRVIETAKAINPHWPIIVLTGDPRESSSDAIQRGVSWYIRKPFNPMDLVTAINELLEQDALFLNIAQTTRGIMGSDQCLVWRYDKKKQGLSLASWADSSTINDSDKLLVLNINNRNLRRILQEDSPTFIQNIQHSSYYHSTDFAVQKNWNFVISIPLRYQGEELGLLESYTTGKWSFPAEQQSSVEKMVQLLANQFAESIGNAELTRKNRILINRISSLTAEQPTLGKFAEAIIKIGVDLVSSEVARFYKVDFEHDCLIHIGTNVQQPRQLKLSEANVVCEVVKNGIIKVINDGKSEAKTPYSKKYRSQIVVPLKRDELTIGVIVLASTLPTAFSEGDISLLRLFSSIAGSAFDQVKFRSHLQEISKSILHDYEALQKTVIHATYDLIGKPVALWLLDEETAELTVVAGLGISEDFKKKAKINYVGLDDSLIAHAFLTKQPINIGDLSNPGSDLTVRLSNLLKKEKWTSTLIVPIFDSERQPIGALAIKREIVGKFTQYEVDFLSNFASQVAIAFENHQRSRRLGQLVKSGQITIEQATGEKNVLDWFVKMACDLTHAPCAAIYPYDTQRKTFFDTDQIATAGLLEKQRTVNRKPRERGLAQIIRHIPEPLVVHDVDNGLINDIDFSRIPVIYKPLDSNILLENIIRKSNFIVREKIKAFIGLSIRVSGTDVEHEDQQEVGVLYINYRAPHHFSSSEIDLIRLFAHQVGSAFQNVRLNNSLVEQVERLEFLHIVGNTLSKISSKPAIIKTVVSEVLNTLSCSHCTYFAREGKQLVPIESCTVGENIRIDRCFDLGVGLVGWAAKSGESVFAPDAKEDPHFVKGKQSPGGERSLIVVPVKIGTTVIGVISADQNQANYFRDRDLHLLEILALQTGNAIENGELVEQRKLLQEVSTAISAASNLSDTLKLIVEGAMKLTATESGVIHLIDSVKLEISQSYAYPEGGSHVSSRFSEKTGLTWEVFSTGEAISIPDIKKNKLANKDLSRDGVCAVIGVPLKIEEKTIGVLFLNDTRLHDFSGQERQLLSTLTNNAAIAIVSTRNYEQRIKDIAALQEINSAIGQKSLKEIDELISQKAKELTNAAYCTLWTLDAENNCLKVGAAYGRKALEDRLPLNKKNINGLVALSRQPYKCNDKDKHYHPWYADIHSILTVPILFKDQLIGTLQVESTQENAYSEPLEKLLQSLADQAAIAITNARQYEQRRRDMAALKTIHEAVASQGPNVLDEIVKQTLSVIPGEYCSMWMEDPDTHNLILTAHYGPQSQLTLPGDRCLKTGLPSINMEVFQTGAKIILPDVSIETQRYHRIYKPARSSLTVPLIFQDKTIGTLNVESRYPGAFTKDNSDLLSSFADQAAIAIELTQNIEEIQKRSEKNQKQSEELSKRSADLVYMNFRLQRKTDSFKALTEIAQQLTANVQHGEHRILEIIHQQASQVMDTDNMYIALYEPERDEVRFELAYIDGNMIDVEKEEGWQPRPAGKGRTECIIHNKKPLLTYTREDAEAWYKQSGNENYIHQPFASWLGVPIMFGDEVLGVIATYHKTDEFKYDPDHEEILTLMGRQAAIALQNARLVSKLDTMRALGEDLGSALSIKE